VESLLELRLKIPQQHTLVVRVTVAGRQAVQLSERMLHIATDTTNIASSVYS